VACSSVTGVLLLDELTSFWQEKSIEATMNVSAAMLIRLIENFFILLVFRVVEN
jgi:hypothetical protein